MWWDEEVGCSGFGGDVCCGAKRAVDLGCVCGTCGLFRAVLLRIVMDSGDGVDSLGISSSFVKFLATLVSCIGSVEV